MVLTCLFQQADKAHVIVQDAHQTVSLWLMRSSPGFSRTHLHSDQSKSVLQCTWPGYPLSTPTAEVFNYSPLNKHIAVTPFCQNCVLPST